MSECDEGNFCIRKYCDVLDSIIRGILLRTEKRCIDIRHFRYRKINDK